MRQSLKSLKTLLQRHMLSNYSVIQLRETQYRIGRRRVTKDSAARPHLPSTVENQLGRRRRQLLTIAQWNVRTLLDRERADRPERRTALVAMELAKYNIESLPYGKHGSQSLVVSTTWNTLSSGVANPKEKEGRPESALLSKKISSQS